METPKDAKYAIHKPKHLLILRKMKPYIGGKVLDYGCGDGFMTDVLYDFVSIVNNNCELSAYAHGGVEQLGIQLNPEVRVYDKQDHIFRDYYDTIISSCTLHHDEGVIGQLEPFLRRGGYVIIVDHDKSHLSEEEFKDWLSDADMREVQQRGIENVLRDHRKMNVCDCCRIAGAAGFQREGAWNHLSFSAGYPFYVYVGRKL